MSNVAIFVGPIGQKIGAVMRGTLVAGKPFDPVVRPKIPWPSILFPSTGGVEIKAGPTVTPGVGIFEGSLGHRPWREIGFNR